jgi:hypothetical protein
VVVLVVSMLLVLVGLLSMLLASFDPAGIDGHG